MVPSPPLHPTGGWSSNTNMGIIANNFVPTVTDVSSSAAIHYKVDIPDVALQLPEQPEQEQEVLEELGAGRSNSFSTKKRAHPLPEMVQDHWRPPSGMVHVTNITPIQQLHYHILVRRTRLTFEALRSAYQRQELSNPNTTRNFAYNSTYNMMFSTNKCLHQGVRIVGDIPGILISDTFCYRNELCVVGLHTKLQDNIRYVPTNLVDEGITIATSIVSSQGYLDNKNFGDVLYYTGSGSDRVQSSLEHCADKKLNNQGNLALHNSYEYGVEVRVIRGVNCKLHSQCHKKVYIYDGLYRVISSIFGHGKSGYNVCKFKLLRLPGQADLGSKSWQIAQQLKDTMDYDRDRQLSLRRGYISLDLSKGTEAFSILVCNTVDDDRSPLLFEYIVRPEFPMGVKWPWRTLSCGSKCRCHCQAKNSGEAPTAYSKVGILEMGRPVVYECGALCGCPITCTNRVTQRGMKHRLEVFRFGPSGETAAAARWGVRTLDLILPGSFVCEYGGEVVIVDRHPRNGDDAPWGETKENRIFIDPMKLPQRWREWEDTDGVDLAIKRHQFPEFAGSSYILDVSRKRNAACYISHSHTPNVFLQYVIRGNEDESFPHLMVFSMETIPPMRELTIDWGIN